MKNFMEAREKKNAQLLDLPENEHSYSDSLFPALPVLHPS